MPWTVGVDCSVNLRIYWYLRLATAAFVGIPLAGIANSKAVLVDVRREAGVVTKEQRRITVVVTIADTDRIVIENT